MAAAVPDAEVSLAGIPGLEAFEAGSASGGENPVPDGHAHGARRHLDANGEPVRQAGQRGALPRPAKSRESLVRSLRKAAADRTRPGGAALG